MALSIFLVVTGVIISAACVGAMIMVLVYFSHPDDKEESIIPKIVVVFGLWLAAVSVLNLPYDVANSRNSGGLRVDLIWQSLYITMAIMLIVIIPFSFFYYEAADTAEEEAQGGARMGSAIKFTLMFLVIVAIVLGCMYGFLNSTDIPVIRYSYDVIKNPWLIVPTNSTMRYVVARGCEARYGCAYNKFYWNFPVTFPIYVMAMISFLGWFFFSAFAGIGLMALPMELINDFVTRPTPMKAEEYARKKTELGQRALKLLEIGRSILQEAENPGANKGRTKIRLNRKTENRFEQAVYMLKKEQTLLFTAHKLKGGNPLWYFFSLIMGILGIALSITWLIHIALFILPSPPWYNFLNDLFIKLEDGVPGFPLFGVCAFAFYTFYLLWCCIKGAFSFGMRIPFLIKIYPMELGNTYLNGFLANTWIIMICSIPCVQFCAQAFPFYARSTAVDLLFGNQIRYLKFFRYFWSFDVFIWMMISFAGIALGYIASHPKDQSKMVEDELKAIADDKGDLLDE